MLFLQTVSSTPQTIVFVAIICTGFFAWVFGAFNVFKFLRASLRWRKDLGYPEALRFRFATTWQEARPAMLLYWRVLSPASKGGVGLTQTEREMRRYCARGLGSWVAFTALVLCGFAIPLI
jgi:hypothetical protein